MSDLTTTAILNYLQAEADDAMGQEPGDRLMLAQAKELIERLTAICETAAELKVEADALLERKQAVDARNELLEKVYEAAFDVDENITHPNGLHDGELLNRLGQAIAACDQTGDG